MQLWRFMMPRALGFSTRNAWHFVVDKVSGRPDRPTQAAAYVKRHAQIGDPEDVLRKLDTFAEKERWLMSVGPQKGPLMSELAGSLPEKPRILELGAYCGYSSIMMAFRFGAEAQISSIEISKASVEASRSNVSVAGLSEQVKFIHGPSSEMIEQLDGRFDLVFLDHWKDLYKSDLQLLEKRGIVGPGSIVVADNVGELFGAHEYLEYVRTCGHYCTENRVATVEYTAIPDAVEISVYKQKSRQDLNKAASTKKE